MLSLFFGLFKEWWIKYETRKRLRIILLAVREGINQSVIGKKNRGTESDISPHRNNLSDDK